VSHAPPLSSGSDGIYRKFGDINPILGDILEDFGLDFVGIKFGYNGNIMVYRSVMISGHFRRRFIGGTYHI
jgi:hypothetical protein